jgi:peroxiredoxin
MRLRRWTILGATGLLGILVTLPVAAQPSWEDQGKELLGKPAPDFCLKDASGKEWKLSDLKGKKVVLLDLGSTGCIPCRATVKDLQKLHEACKDKPVQIFTICVNGLPLDQLKEWAEYMGLTYPVLGDLEFKAAQAYGLDVIPFTVIIDHRGIVRWVHTGHPDDYRDLVTKQLDEWLAKVPAEGKKPDGKPQGAPQ